MGEFDIPWPVSNNPGLKPQEGTGRLINVYVEPRGDNSPVWHRVPGASVFARTPSAGAAVLDFNVNAHSETLFSTFFELVGSSTTQYASSGSASIAYPTNTQSGDFVIVAYAADGVDQPTTPTGYTAIGTSVDFMGAAMWWKVSTGETTVSFTNPNAGASVALTAAIRGVMSTDPIVDTATQSTGASGDPAPPNFTATTADCLMVNVSFMDDDAASAVVAPTTITIAAGSTFGMGGNLFAVSTGAAGTDAATVMMAFRPLATTGAITASTWAVTDGDDEWVSRSFTLRHD